MRRQGVTARILCEGSSLREYAVKASSQDEISGWVASEVGKKYTVHLVNSKTDDSFVVECHIDGDLIDAVFLGPDGVADIRAIKTTDDQEALQNTASLGAIQLGLWRVEEDPDATPLPTEFEDETLANDPVHETSKKAGCHCTEFAEPIAAADEPMTPFSWIDDPNEPPSVRFLYGYRPIDRLRADGIIPRPRAPSQRIMSQPRHAAGTAPAGRRSKRLRRLDPDEDFNNGSPEPPRSEEDEHRPKVEPPEIGLSGGGSLQGRRSKRLRLADQDEDSNNEPLEPPRSGEDEHRPKIEPPEISLSGGNNLEGRRSKRLRLVDSDEDLKYESLEPPQSREDKHRPKVEPPEVSLGGGGNFGPVEPLAARRSQSHDVKPDTKPMIQQLIAKVENQTQVDLSKLTADDIVKMEDLDQCKNLALALLRSAGQSSKGGVIDLTGDSDDE